MRALRAIPNIAKCCLLLWTAAFAFCATSCVGRSERRGVDTTHLQRVDIAAATTDTLHFGRVRTGEIVERQFVVRNSGSQPVLLLGTDTSCSCLELDYPREPIGAGEERVVTMRFFSSGYTYFVPRAFYVRTSLPLGSKCLFVTASME